MTKSERARKDSFWLDGDTSRVGEEPDTVPHYDLEERTARFGEAIIDFAKRIPRGPLTDRIIDQLVGAGTSVGANYCEADDAVSGKEFRQKIGTCKKEARETKHWLRMIAVAEEQHRAVRSDTDHRMPHDALDIVIRHEVINH